MILSCNLLISCKVQDSDVLELIPVIKNEEGFHFLESFRCQLSSLEKNKQKETIMMDKSEHLFTVEYFYSIAYSNRTEGEESITKPKNLTIKSIIRKFSMDSPLGSPKRLSRANYDSPIKRHSSFKIKLKTPNRQDSEKLEDKIEMKSRIIDKDEFSEITEFHQTLCTSFFVAGLKQISNEVIEGSEGLNSYCFHDNFCSKMKAYRPSVIQSFPDESLSTFPVGDNLLSLVFPTGIKICYKQRSEQQVISTFSQQITTEVGEKYTLVVFPIFVSYPRERVIKDFGIDPCRSLINFESASDKDQDLGNKLEYIEQVAYLDNWLVPFAFAFLTKLDISRAEPILNAIVKMIINN